MILSLLSLWAVSATAARLEEETPPFQATLPSMGVSNDGDGTWRDDVDNGSATRALRRSLDPEEFACVRDTEKYMGFPLAQFKRDWDCDNTFSSSNTYDFDCKKVYTDTEMKTVRTKCMSDGGVFFQFPDLLVDCSLMKTRNGERVFDSIDFRYTNGAVCFHYDSCKERTTCRAAADYRALRQEHNLESANKGSVVSCQVRFEKNCERVLPSRASESSSSASESSYSSSQSSEDRIDGGDVIVPFLVGSAAALVYFFVAKAWFLNGHNEESPYAGRRTASVVDAAIELGGDVAIIMQVVRTDDNEDTPFFESTGILLLAVWNIFWWLGADFISFMRASRNKSTVTECKTIVECHKQLIPQMLALDTRDSANLMTFCLFFPLIWFFGCIGINLGISLDAATTGEDGEIVSGGAKLAGILACTVVGAVLGGFIMPRNMTRGRNVAKIFFAVIPEFILAFESRLFLALGLIDAITGSVQFLLAKVPPCDMGTDEDETVPKPDETETTVPKAEGGRSADSNSEVEC